MTVATAGSLTTSHRAAQLAVRAAALRDLVAIWPALDLNRLAATWPAFEAGLLASIRHHGTTSAGLASHYYRQIRDELGAPGRPTPRIVAVDEDAAIAGIRATGVRNAARQLARNRRVADVERATLVNLSGETGRNVLNAGRATLIASLGADRRARGVQRVTDTDPCRWCAARAGRITPIGRFPAHAHCACFPEPVY